MNPAYLNIAIGYGLWIGLNMLLALLCALDGLSFAVVLTGALGMGQLLGVAYWLNKRKE